jgi:hypothetical protein
MTNRALRFIEESKISLSFSMFPLIYPTTLKRHLRNSLNLLRISRTMQRDPTQPLCTPLIFTLEKLLINWMNRNYWKTQLLFS